MPQTRAEIRLSAPTEPGADAANAYHYLIQLSGLYGEAAAFDHRKDGTTYWREAAEQALMDVGEAFHLWETVRARPQQKSPPQAYDAVGRSIVRACSRASRLSSLLGEWAPMLRWVELIRLLERRWQIILEQLAEREPAEVSRISQLRRRSMDRQSRLKGMSEVLKSESSRLDAAARDKASA